MSWFMSLAIGVGIIILCGGVVNWVNMYCESRYKRGKKAMQNEDQVGQRLDEIERRLTDVQDVMIALTEKMDRMEERERI